jgi:anhydro-N-acetylmuramic acid kinase
MAGAEDFSCTAVGVMSGTSVDGLDIALCRFRKGVTRGMTGRNEPVRLPGGGSGGNQARGSDGGSGGSERTGGYISDWVFEIIDAETISWPDSSWPEKLKEAETAGGYALMELHRDFGKFTGNAVNSFLKRTNGNKTRGIRPDIIASHGHTIFHRPGEGITLQIGDGAVIAAITGITTVSDFRRLDVALGGQGAPLVPVGDELLFGNYDYCLNLGGFANISFNQSGARHAFDVCPANIVLNRLARQAGRQYDLDGEIAASGTVVPELFDSLGNIEYYRLEGPRSLGREWVDDVFMPVADSFPVPVNDKMRTICEHIASRVSASMQNRSDDASMLITGGGAKNKFLSGLIMKKSAPVNSVIPGDDLVDFKEALIFAFLGVLRTRNEVNCLASE